MMAPSQFIQFLKWAQGYHQAFARYFEERSHESISPQTQMLLNYLTAHETALARMIAEYAQDAPPGVLNAWFKVSPDLKSARQPDSVQLPPNATVDEVLDLVVSIHDDLIRFYEVLDREALSSQIKAAVNDLLSVERRESIRDLRTQEL
jgi:hypothetical protein